MSGKANWENRVKSIIASRNALSTDKVDWKNALIKALTRLAEKKFCALEVQGWVSSKTIDGKKRLVTISNSADGLVGGHYAIKIATTSNLNADALLTFIVTSNPDSSILSYAVGLQGVQKNGDAWYARICLDPVQRGHGPCSHPLLHCHIGKNASSQNDPRTPLPWITPVEAVEWLMATVEPGLEPSW